MTFDSFVLHFYIKKMRLAEKRSWVNSLSYSMTIAEAIINNHKALDWHLKAFRPPSGVLGVQKLSFFGLLVFLGEPNEVDMLIDA